MLTNTLKQKTVHKAVHCVGIGVHSGERAHLSIRPASEWSGIIFKRTDVKDRNPFIAASWNNVKDTRFSTTIANEDGVSLSTVEHVMAALYGAGVTNALIEVSGPEVPVMDGSSSIFSKLLKDAGIQEQFSPVPVIKILRSVKVTHDGTTSAAFEPSSDYKLSLYFDASGRLKDYTKGYESFSYDLVHDSFEKILSKARTFGFYEDAKFLWDKGLAQGSSLANTVVLKEGRIMNDEGLRYPNEFIRHKILDAVGDFALSNVLIQGEFKGVNSGHSLNNQLLKVLFATPDAWEWVVTPQKPQELDLHDSFRDIEKTLKKAQCT